MSIYSIIMLSSYLAVIASLLMAGQTSSFLHYQVLMQSNHFVTTQLHSERILRTDSALWVSPVGGHLVYLSINCTGLQEVRYPRLLGSHEAGLDQVFIKYPMVSFWEAQLLSTRLSLTASLTPSKTFKV